MKLIRCWLTYIYLTVFKDHPNTASVLICFQKYSEKFFFLFFFKKLSGARHYVNTQHKNLVVIVSRH